MEKYTPEPGSFLSREDNHKLNISGGRGLAEDWNAAMHGDANAAGRFQYWADVDVASRKSGTMSPFPERNEKEILGELERINPNAAKHLRDAIISESMVEFK